MTAVSIRQISSVTTKPNGAWKVDVTQVVPVADFVPSEQSLIQLPAGQVAGNHSHQRREAILGFGEDLWFVWQDVDGMLQEASMHDGTTPQLFVIEPHTPHAVINKSTTQVAILYEYFDGPAMDIVERVLVQAL